VRRRILPVLASAAISDLTEQIASSKAAANNLDGGQFAITSRRAPPIWLATFFSAALSVGAITDAATMRSDAILSRWATCQIFLTHSLTKRPAFLPAQFAGDIRDNRDQYFDTIGALPQPKR
jgi:hypothetical protein